MVDKLIQFVHPLTYEDIPATVIEKAKQIIIDTIGVALAGSTSQFAEKIAIHYLKDVNSNNDSTIIGHNIKSSAQQAALINTIFARVDNFDDTFEPGIIHPGAPVIMSVLAVGEERDINGKDFLTAIVAGYEIAARIAQEINPEHYKKGFHTTGTANCFGTATAVSKVLNLDKEGLLASMGLAATQASGIRQFMIDGDLLTSAFHAGKAAQSGIQSALLSSYGFPSTPGILEGQFGFLNVFTEKSTSVERLLQNLGKDFYITRAAIKPYPCCRFIHGAIDAALQLREQGCPASEGEIQRIKIETFKTAANSCDRINYDSVTSAKFSIQYNIATALINGNVALKDFTEESIAKSHIRSLAKKVEVLGDAALEELFPESWVYRLEVFTNQGKKYSTSLNDPLGSIRRPMSDDQLKNKFESLTFPVLGKNKADELLNVLINIQRIADLKQLASLMVL